MNPQQIRQFALAYFEQTGSTVLEQSPAHLLVHLSETADRALSNRPFYWSFIERTGQPAATMTFLLLFDTERYMNEFAKHSTVAFSIPPRQEELYWGSRMMEQLCRASRQCGTYVNLYESTTSRGDAKAISQYLVYESWLILHCKVSYYCDLMREQLVPVAVNLNSGSIALMNEATTLLERFEQLEWTPQLPANVAITPAHLSLNDAFQLADRRITSELEHHDQEWASEARARLQSELELIATAQELQEDSTNVALLTRTKEIEAQYEPRIEVTIVNGGMFHCSIIHRLESNNQSSSSSGGSSNSGRRAVNGSIR